jgi:hypothetical protein
MAGSTDNNRDNSLEAVRARVGKYPTVKPNEKQEISELPRWVKTALVMKHVDGMTYKDAAARFNRTGKTLALYAGSPAASKWIEHLLEFVEDPVAMAKAYLSANAMSVTLDRIAFLQAAIEAGDYATGDKIAKDLQEKMGIVAKKSQEGALSVKIQLGAGSVDVPVIEAEWEKVGDE